MHFLFSPSSSHKSTQRQGRLPAIALRRLQGAAVSALLMGCNSCNQAPSPGAREPVAVEEQEGVEADFEPPAAKMVAPPGEETEFTEALSRVETVRGLKKKSPVKGLIVGEEALAEHLRNALTFERSKEELRGTQAMLVSLGLVDRQFDFERTMLDLLEENLAGLYEPRLQLMMVRKGLPEQAAEITLYHELVHALQDQYFDLDEIVESTPDDSDRSSALSCLAEGDATSSMLDAILPDGKTALDLPDGSIEAQFMTQSPQSNAPALIVRSLYAPYIDGLRFVHALRRRDGFNAVNKAFASPPLSTEQVLHIEKYDSSEAPIAVPIPPPPSSEWTVLLHDIWGEQSLRLSLEEWMSPERAVVAAAGWGGDRIVSYQNATQTITAWHLVMDNEQEAQELESEMTPAFSELDAPEGAKRYCRAGQEGKAEVLMARRGVHLLLLGSPVSATKSGTCSDVQGWMDTLLVKLHP